jgi:hypothetical protein
MTRILFGAVGVSIFISVSVSAQVTNCTQVLRLARSTYEQGRLHELPTLMTDCFQKPELSGGFTKGERVEAYRLLTLADIYLEDPEGADLAMLNLLKTDPYFSPNKDVDPAEFIALYKTFRTEPVYRLGVTLLANGTSENAVSFNPVREGKPTNQQKLGYGAGFTFEVPLTRKLTFNPQLQYVVKGFGTKVTSYTQEAPVSNYATTTGSEHQGWLSLPVLMQYKLKESSWVNPFLSGGVCVDYLLSSSLDLVETRQGVQSIDATTVSLKPQRQKLNISATAGGGIKARIAGGFLVAEIRYVYGLTNINSSSTLLSNQSALINYGYTDSIFKLNSLYFSVGYVQNFFNPKKKKRK